MRTQLIVSLAALLLAAVGFLGLVVYVLRRSSRGRPVSGALTAGWIVVLAAVVLIAGVKCLESAFSLAWSAADKAADAGQSLISKTVDFGTVGILEGIGKTADHFRDKWRAQALVEARNLTFRIVSSDQTLQDDRRRMTLVLGIENTGDEPVDFNKMVEHQHVLLRDAEGLCYPLERVHYANSNLPPNVMSAREITVTLPRSIVPVALVTPFQDVPIPAIGADAAEQEDGTIEE